MYDFSVENGPGFAVLKVNLKDNEKIKAEGGAMAYMDSKIQMETSSGGLMKGLKRSLTGESMFQNTFTGPGSIVFANILPGDIIKVDVNEPWILSKDVYLAGSPHLEVSSKWGGLKSIIGGEGGFLSHISSPDGETGEAFLGGSGYIQKHEIAEGEGLIVDTGIFF
ncbi:MAG: TIGR00266 family protein, partial [Candidatus Kariarchaeaceae archaeon]